MADFSWTDSRPCALPDRLDDAPAASLDGEKLQHRTFHEHAPQGAPQVAGEQAAGEVPHGIVGRHGEASALGRIPIHQRPQNTGHLTLEQALDPAEVEGVAHGSIAGGGGEHENRRPAHRAVQHGGIG
jgi:hypothetical protein